MYIPFKALLTRPTGVVAIDKFQRDVVEAIKAFVLTIYSKLEKGLVPAPGTDDNSQILFDTGWQPLAGGVVVPGTRVLTAVSPITGGGDLSADRSFGFNQGVALGNNARVAVSKNSGATVGTRREINFIEGANITLTVADDAGNEEVDVTIDAATGGIPVTAVTINVPSPTYEYTATITDAAIDVTSNIVITEGVYADTDTNVGQYIKYYILSQSAGSAELRMYTDNGFEFVGDFKFNYMVG